MRVGFPQGKPGKQAAKRIATRTALEVYRGLKSLKNCGR